MAFALHRIIAPPSRIICLSCNDKIWDDFFANVKENCSMIRQLPKFDHKREEKHDWGIDDVDMKLSELPKPQPSFENAQLDIDIQQPPFDETASKTNNHEKRQRKPRITSKALEAVICNPKLNDIIKLGVSAKFSEHSVMSARFGFDTVSDNQCFHLAGMHRGDMIELGEFIAKEQVQSDDLTVAGWIVHQIVRLLFFFFFKACCGLSWVKMGCLCAMSDHTMKARYEKGMEYITSYLKPRYLGATAFPADTVESEHKSPSVCSMECLSDVRGSIDSTHT